MKKILPLLACLALVAGCAPHHAVLTVTGTLFGLQIAENPSTQLYEVKAGYARSEFAFVPGDTNHPDSMPDVMMEYRAENIFHGGSMYQRLAVGRNAVVQPGAALLFAKDAAGNVQTGIVQAISRKFELIPTK